MHGHRNLKLAELSIQPPNRSVLFLKENDIFLTNDAWRIEIDVDMSACEEAVAAIKADLLLLEVYRKKLTSNSELKQIITLLNTLEVILYNFSNFYLD